AGEEAEGPAPTLDPWERELAFDDLRQELALLENEMWSASEDLDFEKAAAVRDRIREIEARLQGKDVVITTIPGTTPGGWAGKKGAKASAEGVANAATTRKARA